ncbi:GspE/PulE family protein [Noviherbaspirillum pedocola]|uniref:Type II/IV secretion system protein n=1 Tax=Noviherbaspirillum pedocola TaxID=2801341 RepID=A0A934SVB5_9BURK|nr:GspE/PulE family protein [Noviherbaspirillum pedocola]MBK4735816.1 type II/IV secretion system protein [Noviherbaspirillum pedocola]
MDSESTIDNPQAETSSAAWLAATGASLDMRPMQLPEMQSMAPDFDVIPYVDAARRQCVAFAAGPCALLVVTADPLDQRSRAWVEARTRNLELERLEWRMAGSEDLAAYLAAVGRTLRTIDSVGLSDDSSVAGSDALQISMEDISSEDSQIVRLVNSTIYDALRANASDIHLESHAGGLAIKYRLDGVLSTIKRVEGRELAAQVLSRIKVLSELDIAERRVPQDGRFKVSAESREIDLRVSIMPNLFGEDAVLRVLDRYHLSGTRAALSLEVLGFSEAAKDFVRRMAALPYGLLLVTGPTGSGKTTTLYAAINEINDGLDKIITIEDPVEYELPGVLQIPVNEKKGLTFSRGLRSILRHDPDKIMVGEIRDPDTAQIAVQAALTGHQVFTTVHANNVFDVIGRFANMGIDSYSFVSALNGILAQRLVRIACTQCTRPNRPAPELLARSGLAGVDTTAFRFAHGAGCAHCRGSGYKGRRALAETLRIDDEMRDLLAERAPLSKIKSVARAAGLVSLRQAALDLVAQGITTLEEINRVTPVE